MHRSGGDAVWGCLNKLADKVTFPQSILYGREDFPVCRSQQRHPDCSIPWARAPQDPLCQLAAYLVASLPLCHDFHPRNMPEE